MNQLDLVVIYRALNPKMIDFLSFSSAFGTFSRVYHILVNLKKLKSFQASFLTTMVFIRLDTNYREKKKKTCKKNHKHMEPKPYNSE